MGEPTAEFREETHTKSVCVATYMSPAIILVNPADPFFARNSGNIFVRCGQREVVPGAWILMLCFYYKKEASWNSDFRHHMKNCIGSVAITSQR